MSDPTHSGLSISKRGRLLAIGGAARTCLQRLVELTGGDALIVVVPHASRAPRQSADKVCDDLRKAGATNLTVIMPRHEFDIPSGAAAVYLAGGDQSLLVRRLGKDGARRLRRFHEDGGLIAGTSAGAAAMAARMIAGGMDDRCLAAEKLRMEDGLGLIFLTVDTHFNERGRFARPLVAVARLAGTTAVGLDEDTGIIIDFDGDGTARATVCGAGYAWIFSAAEKFQTRPALVEGEPFGEALGFDISVLRAGSSVNLGAGEPRRKTG